METVRLVFNLSVAFLSLVSINGSLLHRVSRSTVRFSLEHKDRILQRHNDARKCVQPPASNMPNLKWNNELEKMAQEYAEKCKFGHNPNSVTESFNYVGENIYANSGYRDPLKPAMDSTFIEEKNNYDFESNECIDKNKMCGHYTQGIWAGSTDIGCGIAFCPTLENNYGEDMTNANFIVCNYGPGGNYRGQKPYKEGIEENSNQCNQ